MRSQDSRARTECRCDHAPAAEDMQTIFRDRKGFMQIRAMCLIPMNFCPGFLDWLMPVKEAGLRMLGGL